MNHKKSNKQRKEIINEFNRETLDLLIIGGGITGAGIALDAQTRGIKTGLIEMQDFAAGTSSRSTKLVHGGLRYLKQFEIAMVAEVGKERAIVYENGPHVTTPEWMLLPIYKGGTFGKFSTSIGLRVYDFLAGVKKKERRYMLNAKETKAKLPLLQEQGLMGGGCYVEYRTDDARLTIEVLKQALDEGALALNYVKAEGFLLSEGQVVGVEAVDQLTGETYTIRAKKIVNAAGPWVDHLREMDRSKVGKTLFVTKGVHLVFDQMRFPLKQAVYFDYKEGRMLFAIPREGKVYVGTTDTRYTEDLANPQMTIEDRDYIMEAVNHMFPSLGLTAEDVESSWAGLRPLIHQEGKGPSEISRKDEIFQSPSGLISIAGGKLTGYRKMAETIVNLVAKQLSVQGEITYPSSKTKDMPISGGKVGGAHHFPKFIADKTQEGIKKGGLKKGGQTPEEAVGGLTPEEAESLVRRYGSNVDRIFDRINSCKQEAEEKKMPLELVLSLVYSMEEEWAVKPTDFFIRRTGALYFNRAYVEKWKNQVIDFMNKKLHWTAEQKQAASTELEREIINAVTPQE